MPTDVQLPPVPLDPWRMFLTADVVVQSVMVILLLASVVTWTILIVKVLEIRSARRRLRAALQAAGDHLELAELRRRGGVPLVAAFAEAALTEMDASRGLPPEGVKERVALVLRRLEGSTARRPARGTGLLASIGSCAPFIGLFGTVWGIMHSFIGISQSHTTNLAVVAPGIAEALLATACGLLAAVPAVLTYNLLARLLAAYRAGLGDLGAQMLTRASRETDARHVGRVVGDRPRAAFERAAE